MAKPLMKTFNVNQKMWLELKPQLGHDYWNVIDQWQRTEFAAHANKFLRTPIYLILLKSSHKFVIIVWGKAAWDTDGFIEHSSVSAVLKELPPVFQYTP